MWILRRRRINEFQSSEKDTGGSYSLQLEWPLPHPLPQKKVEKLLSFYVFMLFPIFQTLSPEYTLLCLKGHVKIICSLIWGSFDALYSTLGGFSSTFCLGRLCPKKQPLILLYNIFVRNWYPLPMTSINKGCLFHKPSNNKSVLSMFSIKQIEMI